MAGPWINTLLRKKITKITSLFDEDVEKAIKRFPGLSRTSLNHEYADGRKETLPALEGTIPVKIADVMYNIPVCVLLQEEHPLVYVKPTSSMAIKTSPHVDENGLIYHPYLHEWNYETSSIKTLLKILCGVFAMYPPLYALHTDSHTPGQQQPSLPSNPTSNKKPSPPSNPPPPGNPLLPSKPLPPMASNPPSSSQQPPGHVHYDEPDAPICSDFLLGKCKKGAKCSGRHCSLPFHWQYKVDEWKSFSETDNEKLEELYCDVQLEECSAAGFQISLESEELLHLDVNFLLDNKLMIVQKDFEVIAQLRRLSTESYAANPKNPVATVWTWYWKNENEIWRQYDVDQLGRDLQGSFEEAFLNNKNCFKFRISDQDYALNFLPPADMYQENLSSRYGTTRKVRRRPAEVNSGADNLELKRSRKLLAARGKQGKNATRAKFPSHWSSMPSDKQYKRISITVKSAEYKEVETLFKRTMENDVTINSIERVQNPFMWEKYQRKKENMMAVKTGGKKRTSVNERKLFHGTSPETVEAICKQNFDWRLRGKNATMYGEGSYFASDAFCSHVYTKEDGHSSRFMFLAKVLVGSYTRGHSSYRRPPQKDPSNPVSDLYDSCVNDTSNPTKFVVFDTDQCYPEYIIKYT